MLVLTFTVGANQYAVSVARVVEVVPRVKLRQISHAPVSLAGLLSFRGKVVPVVDLGLLLGVAPCRDRLSTRIILVNDASDDHNCSQQDRDSVHEKTGSTQVNAMRALNLLGLIAERVSDLAAIRLEQVVAAPVCLPKTPYLGSLVQTDHGIVQLILVERVREASLRSSYLGQTETLESMTET